jgi:PHD/YefM family antitoxin component YafN of YafNO toxin-antitoxin module
VKAEEEEVLITRHGRPAGILIGLVDEEANESPQWHGELLRETEERVRSGVEHVRDWDEAKAEVRKRAE